MPDAPLIRPPIGIMPERYWFEARMHELSEAIRRIDVHPERDLYLSHRRRLSEEFWRHARDLPELGC